MLQEISYNSLARSLPEISDPVFLIFYSSIVDGRLWCSDCRNVDSLVKATFSDEAAPKALLIYVGDKSTWKSPDNLYRGSPWNLKSIPTIVKIKEGKEVARLVDDEIPAGLVKMLLN